MAPQSSNGYACPGGGHFCTSVWALGPLVARCSANLHLLSSIQRPRSFTTYMQLVDLPWPSHVIFCPQEASLGAKCRLCPWKFVEWQ